MTRQRGTPAALPMLLILFLALSIFSSEACSREYGKIKIIASLFPQFDFARQIGGDKVETALLLPPGVEAHSFEPKPRDVARMNEADIFIYTGNDMEPWVGKMLNAISAKNLVVVEAGKGANMITTLPNEKSHGSERHRHSNVDPHIWLDMDNAAVMVDNITLALVQKDPVNKEFYEDNAAKYKSNLKVMDAKFRDSFSRCKFNIFAYAGHPAFNYFIKRYDLKCVSPYKGLCPDSEPSPRAVMNVVDTVKKEGLGVVYYEELLSPKLAYTIANETGAKVLPLNGAHNITREDMENGITFLSIMEENLENLKKGMECRTE